jgi:hypothetical protein
MIHYYCAQCHIVLLEQKTTLNTGNIVNERTVLELGTVYAQSWWAC